MGGGGTTTNTTQQSAQTTQLPPWVNQAAQQNYAYAQNVANRPLTQYQGQQVADVGPQMQQAWNLAATSGGAGSDQYNASQAGLLSAMGTGAQQVTPNTLAGTNLQPYMNPYTQSVINATLPIMQQQLGQQQSQIGGQAAQNNAFGGSRMGVQQGVAQAQGALNMAQMAGQLNQGNYQQAVGQAQTDVANNLQGQLANQGAAQNNLNSLINASTQMGNLGNQAQQNQRQQFIELATAGAGQQQQAQNQINAQMGQFNQANAYPGQQLGVLQSALGMTPYGSATTGSQSGTSTQQTSPSIASDIFGGLQALGGMATGGANSALSGIASIFSSDRHLKTDVAKVGEHPGTGLPIYSYRYKGDPKSYPKVVGPMAEDAMQVAPHAVRTVGVHGPTGQAIHQVDMSALGAPSAAPTMGALGRVPGPLTPGGPMGLTGAMGASMRAPRLRPRGAALPRVAGGMRG